MDLRTRLPLLVPACFAGVAAMALLACSNTADNTAKPAPADGDQTPAENQPAENAPAEGTNKVMPGHLTEDEFMALHQLKGEEAPAPKGQMVELADGSKAYLSLPENATAPLPAIIVIHEWWGLNGHIKNWADRLAAVGYAAVAVDLYKGQVATTTQEAGQYMGGVTEEESFATLDAALNFVKSDERIKASKVGSIGWCFGGLWSLMLATHAPIDAAVIYYGFPKNVTEEQLKNVSGPVLGIFGTQDTAIPNEDVDAWEKKMKELGKDINVLRYDAPHAFANPSGERYHHEPATDAWNHVREFFAKHLKGGN